MSVEMFGIIFIWSALVALWVVYIVFKGKFYDNYGFERSKLIRNICIGATIWWVFTTIIVSI